MKNIKFLLIWPVLATLFLLTSCKEHDEDDHATHSEVVDNQHDAHDEEEGHEEGLHLTSEQIKAIGLEFGTVADMKVNDYVKATGTLGLPPSAYASVTPKAAGIVSGNRKFVEGNAIQKGAIIAYIENPDFIIKQQEYLEAKAQLAFKKLELKRQQKLVQAQAGVTKNLENAQAEVNILEAKTMGLGKQLAYLGISTAALTPETIRQKIPIYSPMTGYITSINLHNGMYANPMNPLMEIVSDGHLHLELDVFEKDIAKIKIGQKISYVIPALGSTVYDGEVSIIGKEFNMDSKTIRVHGHLDGQKPKFFKDLFINAQIWLNDVTESAIPESAIVKDGASLFVYAAHPDAAQEEVEFEKLRVIAGTTINGFTSVKLLDPIPEGMKIVTKGAYYVYAQSKAGELEHEH